MARKPLGQLRCASYSRCSTDDQKHGDFTTIDTQRQINSDKAAALGGVIVGDYADEGKSGTNLNRSDWKRLLADAKAGLIDVVIVSYMSRLGRGEMYYIAEYLLKEANVQISMVKEQFTDDLAGYANKTMKVFLDGMYPKQVSEWTKTKMEQMVAKGFRCGGALPYGYTTETVSDPAFARADKEPPKRLIVTMEEAPFVVQAFNVFADTKSFVRVRQYLTSVTDREWSLYSATRLLHNEVYRGVLVFGEWRNETAHEAIITPELWLKVQDVQNQRVRPMKSDAEEPWSFYLRGRVYCTSCGYRMTPANHHGRTAPVRYYECINNTKHKKPCPVKRINAHALHNEVIEQIRRAAAHPTRLAELIREAVKMVPPEDTLTSQILAVAKRAKDVEKRTKAVLTAIEAGGAGLRALLTRLEELQEQQQALQAEQYELAARRGESHIVRPDKEYVQATWSRFIELWEDADDQERHTLMPLLVERVDMTEKERGTCRLSFVPADPRLLHSATSNYVAINSSMGAGAGLEPATFGL